MAKKKDMTTTCNFFQPLSFVAVLDLGSGIRYPGSGMGKSQDPVSGINIPDPQYSKERRSELRKFLMLVFVGDEMSLSEHTFCNSAGFDCGVLR